METFYVDWLGEERPLIQIPIDKIYCKHESSYKSYRNNYRLQLVDLLSNPSERFIIERERNKRLVNLLGEQGELYPIAVHEIYCEERKNEDYPYVCIDGHHRIMAYLAARRGEIPAVIYKNADEAGLAKANAKYTDYYQDLLKIDKEIHKEN